MIPDMSVFDTNVFFSGGAGMFIQYHDIIKPVQLYAIIRMMLTGESFGLPIQIIRDMRNIALIEWYIKRPEVNPLKQLDFSHKIDPAVLDDLMRNILLSDKSIYLSAPVMNVGRMFSVYHRQHMNFPVFVYSEQEEPFIKEDCKNVLQGIPVTYLFGSLKDAISKCSQNFTYIFSDIELAAHAIEILHGTMSHVLVANDYRYNHKFVGTERKMKHNLLELAKAHPVIRTGTMMAVDQTQLAFSVKSIYT